MNKTVPTDTVHITKQMTWEMINASIDRECSCKINDTLIRLKIMGCSEMANGGRWVSFQFLDNKHMSPYLYGTHTGHCNSIFEPQVERSIRGWCSQDIFDTLEFTDDI